jgi:LAO/AO transport system kinase
MSDLAALVLAGNRRALARLLTQVENGSADDALAALFPHTGHAHIIGITGAPGAGKSTLVAALTKALRARGDTVAILAVDPSSPFTGGAIMGDRIRMGDLHGDSGVFIRSMATRGGVGGLAAATRDAARVLDAAEFSVVIIETVGAGQSEVEIAQTAHTVVVVEAPGMGDEVQAIKAGILEIADVLVVNKADRPGVENTVRALKMIIELGHPVGRDWGHHGSNLPHPPAPPPEQQPHPLTPSPLPREGELEARKRLGGEVPIWLPPIVQTIASEGKGVDELLTAIDAHSAHLASDGQNAARETAQIADELAQRLRDALFGRWLAQHDATVLSDAAAQVQARTMTPQSAMSQLLDRQEELYQEGKRRREEESFG